MLKRAFTLAEVLITLTIIGIVAAITIPGVIANSQQTEYRTGLRKAVSSLDQAVALNIAIEGENPYQNTNLFKYLQRHMTVVRSYPNGYHDGIANYSRGTRRVLRNKAFYTKDGIRYEIFERGEFPYRTYEQNYYMWGKNSRCGNAGLITNDEWVNWSDDSEPCIVTVDVNGDRKPHPITNRNANQWNDSYPSPYGTTLTDIFTVLITKDGAVPFGVLAQKAMYSGIASNAGLRGDANGNSW